MKAGPVLLLHAVSSRPEAGADPRLHNIHPRALLQLLSHLQTQYQFVTVDAYVAAEDRRGLAALTFDDGYRSVFEEALPVLESLGLPCTIFLNGHTVRGGLFWRDKVRWLIHQGLAQHWLDFAGDTFALSAESLYMQTKQPQHNSRLIDQSIDAFLAELDVRPNLPRDGWTTDGMLPNHPLVHYGNHGHRHYMLSSLSREEQLAEIMVSRDVLAQSSPKPPSHLFSMPFGTPRSYNAGVLNRISEAGYRGVLLSSLRRRGKVTTTLDLMLVSRWYVPRRVMTKAVCD